MFALRCMHSGYFLTSFSAGSGRDDVSFHTSFHSEEERGLLFKCKDKANDLAGLINRHGAAKLPVNVGSATHVELEVLEL